MLEFKQAMTDDEIRKMGLIVPGNYKFRVVGAVAGYSKSGNSMITLTMLIHTGQEHPSMIKDFLMTTSKQMMFKVKHFCEATGLEEKFNSGKLIADDLVGREGVCKIETQPARDGYDEKSGIVDYILSNTEPKPIAATASEPFNDDIPF